MHCPLRGHRAAHQERDWSASGGSERIPGANAADGLVPTQVGLTAYHCYRSARGLDAACKLA